MTTLLIATRNAHKVAEIRAILGPQFNYLSLNEFESTPTVVEDAPAFSGNATKKAVTLARWLKNSSNAVVEEEHYVLADDSGLEVDKLNGAPGVHSARFAAMDQADETRKISNNSADVDNNLKLLRLLEGAPKHERTARFRCVIALTPVLYAQIESASPVCYADEFEMQTLLFEGACEGHIGSKPRGGGGFGYDPLFVPDGFNETFAELGEDIKNRLSHRAKALARLQEWFKNVGAA